MKAGDTAQLKTEKRTDSPVFVELIERSGRYAGWKVKLPSGCEGIALDIELIELMPGEKPR